MREYHKIQSVYKRDEKTKRFIEGEWTTPEFEYLQDAPWDWTEKIDGTNVRVHFDGTTVRFGGRTDNAQMPVFLLERLQNLFYADKMAESFERNEDGSMDVTLYGEGYGAKIQKGGGLYKPDGVDFILFDVNIGGIWLRRDSVMEIGSKLSVDVVPSLEAHGTLVDAVEFVKRGGFDSKIGTAQAEGLVCRPSVELLNRMGKRIITKVKTRDFI